ncbi:hypothetical protein MUP59_08725, partial [Candidatus Bathyarchaeota archaeon]|nr:hypothetical protein [Candidatus Bathyarchaeota archaeon]
IVPQTHPTPKKTIEASKNIRLTFLDIFVPPRSALKHEAHYIDNVCCSFRYFGLWKRACF